MKSSYQLDKTHREAAHDVFDQLWSDQSKGSRTKSYQILTNLLVGGKQKSAQRFAVGEDGFVHFSYMDSEQCVYAIAKLLTITNNIDFRLAKKIARRYFSEYPSHEILALDDSQLKVLEERSLSGAPPVPLKTRSTGLSELDFFILQLKDFIKEGGINKLEARHQEYWSEIQKKELQDFNQESLDKLSDAEKLLPNQAKKEVLALRELADYLHYQNRFTVFDLALLIKKEEKPEKLAEEKAVTKEAEKRLPKGSTEKKLPSKSKKKGKPKQEQDVDFDAILAEMTLENKGRLSVDEILDISKKTQSSISSQEEFDKFFLKIKEHVESFTDLQGQSDPSLILALGEFMRIVSLKTTDAGNKKLFDDFLKELFGKLQNPKSLGVDFRSIVAKKCPEKTFVEYCTQIICNAIDLKFDVEVIRNFKTIFDKINPEIFGSEKVFLSIVRNNPSLLEDDEIKKVFQLQKKESLAGQIRIISDNINLHEFVDENVDYLLKYIEGLGADFIKRELDFETKSFLVNRILIFFSFEDFERIFGKDLDWLVNKKDQSYSPNVLYGAMFANKEDLVEKVFHGLSSDDKQKRKFLFTVNQNKESFLIVAAHIGFPNIFGKILSFAKDDKEKRELLSVGDANGYTPLIIAGFKDHFDVLVQITDLFSGIPQREKFSYLTRSSNTGDTALMSSSKVGSARSAEHILEQVLSMDQISKEDKLAFLGKANKYQATALIVASDFGFTDVVGAILSAANRLELTDKEKFDFINSCFTTPDNRKINALDMAVERGRKDIVIKIMEFVPEQYRAELANKTKSLPGIVEKIADLFATDQSKPSPHPHHPVLDHFKEEACVIM